MSLRMAREERDNHQTEFSLGSKGIRPRRKFQFAMAALMNVIGRYQFDSSDFQIVPLSISIPRLDPVFDGYRVVHISDLHLGQWLSADRLRGVVGMINEQHPDLIAITGDFVSFAVDEIAADLEASLRNLRPKDASLAVLGNHDHWMGAQKVRRILAASNIIDLDNEVYAQHRGNAQLQFAGLDDVMVKQHDLDKVLSKLNPSHPAILLVHEPDFADVSALTGRFNLQLSGHSHGGQFILPEIGTVFRGSQFKKYPAGRYQVKDMVVYTNRGLGTNTLWLRINCSPEITVLTLHAGS